MAVSKIPEEVQLQVAKIVADFNKAKLGKKGCKYVAQYKGNYLYLLQDEGIGKLAPTVRLKFRGKIDNWEFAIFKWSSESYTDDTFGMPGYEFVDGTVEGAMKAGLKLYPAKGKEEIEMMQNIYDNLSKMMGLRV